MSEIIENFTSASFDAEVRKPGAVLVDFWADWCGPCKMLSPILTDLAEEYVGVVRVAKVNADENQEVAERLTVRGLPTLVLFVDGVEKGRITGLTTKSRLCAFLDTHTEA